MMFKRNKFMIEKSGTGLQNSHVDMDLVEKNGTGISRFNCGSPLIEKNGTGIQALSSAILLALAVSASTNLMAQERSGGYVLVDGSETTISINNELFSTSGTAEITAGYTIVPLRIVDGSHLKSRVAAMAAQSEGSGTGFADSEGSGTGFTDSEGSGTGRPSSEGSGTGRIESEGSGTGRVVSEGSGTGRIASEGSGTGRVASEGSGTGRVASEGSGTGKVTSEGSGTGRVTSEGSGTGRVASEGSGTGRVNSEGSGTGRASSEGSGTGRLRSEGSGTGLPTSFSVNVCLDAGRLSSAVCDSGAGDSRRTPVVDGFAEIAVDGMSAYVVVYQLLNDGSVSEFATLKLPVIEQ